MRAVVLLGPRTVWDGDVRVLGGLGGRVVVRVLTNNKVAIACLAVIYALASGLTYVTFRRYPDQSGMAAVQWLLFYVVTVVYPLVWAVQNLRLVRKLERDQFEQLRRYAWAPVIVGMTSLLTGLSLLFPLLR